jgi:3-methyl-2-oxobutanoate hydroxymethyltransferase
MSRRAKVTIRTLLSYKRAQRRVTMLTCYDYSTARLMEEAGLDSLLVGDTYGEVCLGHASTHPVTLDQLVTVAAGVRRGAPSVYLIGDMPFMSYHACEEDAIRNGGRFLAESGCDAVKVEVDRRLLNTVKRMSAAGLPVIAHLGLRPQWINAIGGYIAQGKTAEEAVRLMEDARMMVDAGAVALLLEAVPARVASLVTRSVPVPVIGCASGPDCDGQVVVMHDMLGYASGHPPRSVKVYANLRDELVRAFSSYAGDVQGGGFPSPEHSIPMPEGELERLERELQITHTEEDLPSSSSGEPVGVVGAARTGAAS